MKKLAILVVALLSASVFAEEKPTPSQALAILSFPNTDFYKIGSVEEKRAARALDNVNGLCSDNLNKVVDKSVAIHEALVKNGYYVTPVEIVEALGTLKRQAPDGVDCDYILTHYASTMNQTPTPAEALASINSLYKILKSAVDKE
ncbi:hypothetical protein BKK54_06465 [Rodentibacter genomosp. 1]|uniref:Uncharacterized protein n=1 Tax=Rodentibacter genomosp. 1 TaxID=1908264 RepID=A0A1V3J528_9PAST|nr:hypothetical protein [Rodentibacter genomosp. 1]OOF50286.1 hypothetical protein BKK54_06465 [Rodentibacter genomosp. 1]